MKATDILNKAAGHMKDRATTYDNAEGERSMGKTVAMFNTLYGTEVTEEQGWAFMGLLKMVRSSQGAYRADNYEDLVAYASLMGESAGCGEVAISEDRERMAEVLFPPEAEPHTTPAPCPLGSFHPVTGAWKHNLSLAMGSLDQALLNIKNGYQCGNCRLHTSSCKCTT
jgi:hypothetical protein